MPRALRTRHAAALAVAALLASTAPRGAVAQDIMSSVSDNHMESLLQDMDISFTKGSGEHTWRLKLESFTILLLLANDNTDGQLYVGFGDVTVGASKMNEWNKTKRFARAYADDDGNPVLESDLDFAGGVTDDAIKAWIRLFESSVTSYVKFLNN
jgi:hypothetical protein